MKTYLELKDMSSQKFWQIETNNESYTVTFGKIGTSGQSKTKSFGDAQSAEKDALRLIASKKKKGYAESENTDGQPVKEPVLNTVPEQKKEMSENTEQKELPVQKKSVPRKERIKNMGEDPEELLEKIKKDIQEAFDQKDFSKAVDVLKEAKKLKNPKKIFHELLDKSNEMINHSYMNGFFQDGWDVARAYADVFPLDDPWEEVEMETHNRQVIASNCVVLTIFSGNTEIEKFVFEKILPDNIYHGVLAFNLSCYYAKKKNKKKLYETAGRAIALGKTQQEFLEDADFAEYLDDKEFRKIIYQPSVKELEKLKKEYEKRPFTEDDFKALTAMWFLVNRMSDLDYKKKDKLRENIQSVIKKFGEKNHQELVKRRYDFDVEADLFRYVCESKDSKLIGQMFYSYNNEIHVGDSRVRFLPDELADFQEIDDIHLGGAYLKEFPPAVLKLKKLEHLNLYSSKIEVLPDEICSMTQLTNLSMERNRLKTLPACINRLVNLEELDLYHNILEDVPEELCELEKLERVNFSDNPDIPGKQLTSLFEDFYKQNVPVSYRKILLNLLLSKLDRADELSSLQDIVNALNSPIQIIRTNAVFVLDRKTKNQKNDSLKENQSFVLIGKLSSPVKQIRDRLKDNGFQTASGIDKNPDWLILGEKPGNTDLNSFQGGVLSENAFLEKLNQIDTPYLMEKSPANTASGENLKELMRSPDPANQKIALEIIKGGGLPEGMLQDLFTLAYLSSEAKIRKDAKNLLKQYANPVLQSKMAVNANFLNVSTESKMNEYIENFTDGTGLDPVLLAESVYLSTGRAMKYLIENASGERFLEIIKDFLKQNETDSSAEGLDLSYRDLESVPEKIKEVDIQSLRLHSNLLKSFPLEVCEMVKLQSLDLSHNKIKEIPAEIKKLTDLHSLNIAVCSLRKLPEEIGALENLTELDLWGNSIKKFPQSLQNLQKLKKLRMGCMNLKEIPIQVCMLKSLESITFYENGIVSLPDGFENLINLKELNLRYNPLSEFPLAVLELVNLEELELDSNNLKFIPPEVTKLKNLKRFVFYAGKQKKINVSADELKKMLPGCQIITNIQ